ncbi:MAG: hypothetical protein Q8930_05170 [Bacillota bacterium]|nr:hypothetical protein [Bacillota bacterium]
MRIIDKIKVDIYGNWDEVLEDKKKCGGSCAHTTAGITIAKGTTGTSGGCSCGSGSPASKTTGMLFEDLKVLLDGSDVKDSIELSFFDLRRINVLDFDQVRTLTEEDFEPPYVIIDGIARYYGGISSPYIYNDIKELLGQAI